MLSKYFAIKILEFLTSKQILVKYYRLYICCDYIIIDEEKLSKYLRLFELKESEELSDKEGEEFDNLYTKLDYLTCFCLDCDSEIEITKEMIMDTVNNPNYLYKIVKERDKSYDNI